MTEIDPVGQTIDEVMIRTEERDNAGNWVGADLSLTIVAPPARYVVRVVTKEHFVAEHIEAAFGVDEAIEDVLNGLQGDVFERPPYVLNDSVLSEEVIRSKFVGRTILSDLAACLYRLPDTTT